MNADSPPVAGSRLRVVVFLLLGLLAVDVVLAAHSSIWTAYDPEEYRERLESCRRRPHDLVIAGGSTVGEGIDPTLLTGVVHRGHRLERVFALGLPGGTTSDVWHGVRHGLPTPPRVLVYGITASDLNDARHEPEGARSLMGGDDLLAAFHSEPAVGLRCARHSIRAVVGRVWNLYRYRNGIRLWTADRVESLWPGLFPEAVVEARQGLAFSAALRQDHGFAPRPDAVVRRFDELKAGGSLGPPFHFLDRYRTGGEHTTCLHRLFAWAEQNQVELILLDMPVSADLDQRIHPEEFAAFRRTLADLELKRNVQVLRPTREAVRLSDADFADIVHLNGSGATKLSQWLRHALEAESEAVR